MSNSKINGVDLDAVREGMALARKRAGASRAPKSSRIEWLGGVRFKTHVRKHAFIVDEPVRLGGEDQDPNSMEYVLGAYGACLATGFVLNASKKHVRIHELEITLESTQDNTFPFLGLGTEGHPGFDRIQAKLTVKAEADEATIRELWERTVRTSPVHNTLVRPVDVEPELEIVG